MSIINRKKDGKKYSRSSLERKFERIWKHHYPELDLIVEQSLVEGRRFRSDFLHKESKTVIEINGGEFKKISGHKTGASSDAEKQNLLTIQGYKVFVLWTSQVNVKNIQLIGDFISSL